MQTTRAAQFETAVYRKVTWHIVPLVILAFTAAYLARVNIGLAKLQMLSALHFSDSIYGVAAGIFFVGYLIFEVPSNLLLHKIGARLSITRIMILWGIISACMMFVSSAWLFYLLRFLLGAAEAGFFPGIILYLTYWYPSQRRAATTALFMASIPISGLVGSPVSGWIMHGMDQWHGLAGWRWMFLIEAIPSIIIGFIVLFVMKDRIEDAPWLDAEEKAFLREQLSAEEDSKEVSTTGHAFRNPYIWLMCGVYGFLTTSIYGITFWLPTYIKAAGVKDVLTVGILTAIPYLFSILGMIVLARSSDKSGQRRWYIAVPSIVSALALIGVAQCGSNLTLTMIFLTIASVGIIAALPLFWPMPTALLSGAGAAAGIALINSLGNFSVFFSQPLMGWLNDVTHSEHSSIYFMVFTCLGGAALALVVPKRLVDKQA